MANKINRVEFSTSYGDKSDIGIVYIDSIHAYDEEDEEILTNDFINSYNQGSDILFYQEDDDIRYNEICKEIAQNLGISVDQIC